jgi:hypothetical protein
MKTFRRSSISRHAARPAEHSWSRVRARVAAAFRGCGIGVDPITAQRRSIGFYRSSTMAWARALG